MIFSSTHCEFCGGHAFKEADVVAYKVVAVNHGGGPHTIDLIDLKGEQPWAGIRCVHKACIERLFIPTTSTTTYGVTK